MIFDDILLQNQKKSEMYYTRCRHSNVDCFYLAENYFKLPRQTIRENSNFICLLKQDIKNINNIYQDHVSEDLRTPFFDCHEMTLLFQLLQLKPSILFLKSYIAITQKNKQRKKFILFQSFTLSETVTMDKNRRGNFWMNNDQACKDELGMQG